MNRGYFTVSKELLNTEAWAKMEPVIKSVFQEVERKEIGRGDVEFHGYSDLFTIQPAENASQQYLLWFERNPNNLDSVKVNAEPV